MASKLCPHHVDAVVERHDEWEDQTERGFKVAVLSMLNWAVKEGFVSVNPLQKRLDIPPVRSRGANSVLGDEDFTILVQHANGPLRDLLTACRHTGSRPGTIAAVSAEQGAGVRFVPELRQIIAATHKTDDAGDNLVIDLDDTAFELCYRLATQHPTGPLFRNNLGNSWTAEVWGRAWATCEKAWRRRGSS